MKTIRPGWARWLILCVLLGWLPSPHAFSGASLALAQQRQRTPRAKRRLALQLIQRGVRALSEKKYKEAIGLFEEAQRLSPGERALFLLGQAFELSGDPERANRTFGQLSSASRTRLAGQLVQRGLEKSGKGDHAAAIADLYLADRLQPTPQTKVLLGQSQDLGGRLEAARRTYEAALATAPREMRPDLQQRLDSLKERLQGSPTDSTPPPTSMATDLDDRKQVNLGDARDNDILGGGSDPDGGKDLEKKLELGGDKFQIGGQLFLRFDFRFSTGQDTADHPFSMPNLANIYLDGRPNDRIRAFLLGRLTYNPSVSPIPAEVTTNPAGQYVYNAGRSQFSAGMIELWLKFDLARRVFFTLGQQMVYWGTTKIWNPVDVINLNKRPVLSPLDERSGIPLIKIHVPVESLGWNFYALGFADSVDTLDSWGIAGRAEFVYKTAELGIVSSYRKDIDPKIAMDLSAGLWNFDLLTEVGLRVSDRYPGNVALQLAAGLQYTIAIFSNDQLVLGGEYFYNQEGSSAPEAMSLFDGSGQRYYIARHYGALSLALPGPGRLDNWSFTGKAIANLNDLSVIAQLIVGVKFLDFLNLQAILGGHMGRQGELRIGEAAFADADERARILKILYPKDTSGRLPTQLIDFSLWLSLEI